MTGEALVPVRMHAGRYEGVLTVDNPSMAHGLEAVHEGKVVAVATLIQDEIRPTDWRVAIDLPASLIADGVQVIAIRSVTSGAVLDRITLMAGAPLDEDFRAEIALLRDELEMLKRAFRSHCAQTAIR